jgi:hypothetical protein
VGDFWFWSNFLPLKIQINSQKPGFGRKNSLVVTLVPTAQATLVNIQIPLKWIYEAGLYKNLQFCHKWISYELAWDIHLGVLIFTLLASYWENVDYQDGSKAVI